MTITELLVALLAILAAARVFGELAERIGQPAVGGVPESVDATHLSGCDSSQRPIGTPDRPNWIRVSAAVPDVYERLRELAHIDGGVLEP